MVALKRMPSTEAKYSLSSTFSSFSEGQFVNASFDTDIRLFGNVTDGLSVVDAIGKVKTGFAGPHQNVPETAVVIKKVTVSD